MKTTRFFLILVVTVITFGTKVYGNNPMPQGDKDFSSFLTKFTSSAAFQYSRVKFPLKSPIILMANNGSEVKYPFTKDKWPLIPASMLKVGNAAAEGGGTYIGQFSEDTPTHKVFQAGYEDSEIDLKVTFDLINGQWFVTDCYTAWYNFELSITEFKENILQVQKENATFKKTHP